MSAFSNPSQNFLDALTKRYAINIFAYIETQIGLYIYGRSNPTRAQLPSGNISLIDSGARLKEFPDSIDRDIFPGGNNLIDGLTSSELTEFTISVINTDHHLSKQVSMDEFLDAECWLMYGFKGLGYDDYLEVLRGTITGYNINHERVEFRVKK